jgi:type I restriction enzyme, R subunit
MSEPEQQARRNIDNQLIDAGWVIQDMKDLNLGASLGVAVREYPTDSGPADYILFVERKHVGVIEAKKEGKPLISVHEQTTRYGKSNLKWCQIADEILPFLYESTGVETYFADYRDPKPRSREIFSFHKPETLRDWLKQKKSLRAYLQDFPELEKTNLRDCQFRAINNLEESFKMNKPRALIQMATGAGKTYTAITSVYRLLKYAKAKRILFLVDTKNLGEQAQQEFQAYTPSDDNRKFTELYNVQRLSSNFIDNNSQVCISTIQRMYSILRGEELEDTLEETSLHEVHLKDERPKDVAYNPEVPVEQFDFIIIDECHRSIYNLWKQVLDYFDAFLIGLTATPDSRTFAFFHENVVSEYSHENAVADGVNVGFDVYTIETEITKNGAIISKTEQYVETRGKMDRKTRWEQIDEDIEYNAKQLDKDIVNKNQIRKVIQTFRDKLKTEIFPQRNEVPKTLIFAKTDSHADDIIQIVREEFGEGNDFCKKVTYGVKDDKPSNVLQAFRNSYYPRIAVTVDMIATGTDVKPIECLLFMRDVKSKNYFEQMKGRGTRTLMKDDLKKVTPSAISNKTHFVIVDAVGVCKSVKTDSRPLERKKTIPLKDLMMNVVMGNADEDITTTLASRINRLEKQIDDKEKEKIMELSGGKSINEITHDLLNAYDPDEIKEKAKEIFKLDDETPTPEQLDKAKNELIQIVKEIFDNPDLREYIENCRKIHNQIIDNVNLDNVTFAGFDEQAKEKALKTIGSFKEFLEKNKNEIIALRIYYDQAYRNRKLTFSMIKELNEKLEQPPYLLTLDRIWEAYKLIEPERVVSGKKAGTKRMLTDIVSLVRHAIGLDELLQPYSEKVNTRFKEWVFKKNAGHVQFSEEQMEWLRMIKDHIIASVTIEKDDFDYSPFVDKGGLTKVYKLFGDELDNILEEINVELVA